MSHQLWIFILTKVAPIWLTAIGTVGTVITAIWLALRGDWIRLRVHGDVRLLLSMGDKPPYTRYLVIDVVNRGRRSAKVTLIGWRMGALWFKKYAWQNPDPRVAMDMNSKLPVVLNDGDSAPYLFLLDVWLIENGAKIIGPWARWPWFTRWWLRVTASTSTGKTYIGRIGHSFAKEVHEYYMRTRHGGPASNDETTPQQ